VRWARWAVCLCGERAGALLVSRCAVTARARVWGAARHPFVGCPHVPAWVWREMASPPPPPPHTHTHPHAHTHSLAARCATHTLRRPLVLSISLAHTVVPLLFVERGAVCVRERALLYMHGSRHLAVSLARRSW
jgi:hypothetical protein